MTLLRSGERTRVVVTGAFGFTGRWIARHLLERGVSVCTLTDHPERRGVEAQRMDVRCFDFDDPERLAGHLEGADVLFNTYWIRFERGRATFARAVERSCRLFEAAKRAGVRRVVHVSIANPDGAPDLPYYRGKTLVERALRSSGLSHAVVRPTVLFGDEGILIHNIAWLLRRLPVFAVVGDGGYRIQPVHVDDLARLAVELAALRHDVAVDAAGPEIFPFLELVQRLRSAVGSAARIVHVPAALGRAAARGIGLALRDVLITRDELVGLRRELLVSKAEPSCPTRLTGWLGGHSAELGTRYRSELGLHYAPRLEARS